MRVSYLCGVLLLASDCMAAMLDPPCLRAAALAASEEALQFFANVFHPRTPADFLDGYFETGPFVMRRNSPGFFSNLISLNEVLDIVDRGSSPANSTEKIRYGSDWKLLKRIHHKEKWWTGVLPVEKIKGVATVQQAFHHHGFSLVMNKIQAHSPQVNRLARLLEEMLGWRVSVNLYLSPANSQGFEVHIDWMDGLILQVLGSKQWTAYDPIVFMYPRADNVFHMTREQLLLEASEQQFNLSAGDVAYIPRGLAHEAIAVPSAGPEEAQKDLSLHLTVGLETATHFSVEVLLHNFVVTVKQQLNELKVGGDFVFFADKAACKPCDSVPPGADHAECIAACSATEEDPDSPFRVAAVDGVSQSDVMHFLLSSAAGLTGIGKGAHLLASLRRSVAVTKNSLDIERLHPSGALPAAFAALFRISSFGGVLEFAISRGLIELVLNPAAAADLPCLSEHQEVGVSGLTHAQCVNVSDRLTLSPEDRVLKDHQEGKEQSKHPLRYLDRFLSTSSRDLISEHKAPFVLQVSDASAFDSIRKEKEEGYSGPENLYYSHELLVEHLRNVSSWRESTLLMRELFSIVFLCDDLSDCSGASEKIDSALVAPLTEGTLSTDRMCGAYEHLLEDATQDRKSRQGLYKKTLRRFDIISG